MSTRGLAATDVQALREPGFPQEALVEVGSGYQATRRHPEEPALAALAEARLPADRARMIEQVNASISTPRSAESMTSVIAADQRRVSADEVTEPRGTSR